MRCTYLSIAPGRWGEGGGTQRGGKSASSEEEGHELFEAFQKMYKEAKRAQRSARPKQQIERIVEPCVVGGDFMADGPRAAVAE